LSPTLETPVLLQNTFNNALDGAIGAGLDVYEKTEDFEKAYLKRWNDYPSDGAYYYYDAVTILGLAYARTLYLKEKITYENITASIIDITTPSGVQLRWSEVDKGIDLIQKGRTIYYSGLTGPILLDRNGQQQAAPMKLWTISSDKIEYYDSL
jgi:ABC-type branched-subunit amino acid transport system substrate-binding protein